MEVIENKEVNQLQYAGFWLRLAAYLIDSIVLSVAELVLVVPVLIAVASFAVGLDSIENLSDLLAEDNLMKLSFILGGVLTISLFSLVTRWLYYALFESSNLGATPGKMAVGIKVTTYTGHRLSFGRATGRYFARKITNLTLLVGYVMAAFTEKQQALHDIIAGCIVVRR